MPNPIIRERQSDGEEYKAPLAILECSVERVTYHNEENGYAVLKVTMPDAKGGKEDRGRVKDDVITVLGNFTSPTVGESLRCHGTWIKHPQYGSQFKCERYETLRPATAAAMEKYLGSGMVKGIGPVMAKRIVAEFGDKSLDVIEHSPRALSKVAGLGEKRIDMIKAAWDEQREVREIMLFLQGHGVTPTYAVKIFKFYKERSIEIVERNPYQLATDIWGIGFKSADKIAQNIGIAPDAPERLEAGLIYVLNDQMESGGHCYLPREELIKKACEILLPQTAPDGDEEADKESVLRAAAIELCLDALIERGLLVSETVEMMGIHDTAIYTPSIHTTEKAVAERINTILNSPWRSRPKPSELEDIVTGVRGYDTLSEEQQEAVRRSISEPMLVLTGGPGTGKCVRGDTLVLGADGLRPIDEHWGGCESLPDTFQPYSVNVVAKDKVTATSHVYYGGIRDTVRLQTHLGLELEGTPNHRIWAMTPKGPEWVRLDQITAETYVAVRRGDDIWPQDGLHPEVAYLFGALSGDGCLTEVKTVSLTNNDTKFLENCQRIMWEHFQCEGRISPSRNTFDLRAHGVKLRRLLAQLGRSQEKSGGKLVPHTVLRSSRNAVIQYLAGLFDTDGHVAVRDSGQVSFEITLKNRAMIRQAQLLLLNLGIISRCSEKTVRYRYRDRPEEMRSYWRLNVSGQDADLLLQIVPTVKAVAVQERRRNTNRDVVPLPGDIIRQIFTSSGERTRQEWWKWKREIKGNRRPTRGRLLEMLESVSITSDNPAVIALREACRPCYFWDKITNIAGSSSTVYDLTVPGEESFVANGFVNHNTTTTRAIVAALEKMGKRIQLASPTGRAAKRAAEVTGMEAKTIHRMLAFDPEKKGFKHGPGEPLELDVLIIDESSMLDLSLTHNTLRAVPNGAQVLFVGDVDQLPSVGPGNVLNDLIQSGRVPVARLTQVFRQAAASKIITNAHAINRGKMPELPPPSEVKNGADCVFIEVEEPEEALEKIKGVVAKSLPRLGFKPEEITLLTPMQRGSLGARNLNETLQAVLNPPAPHKKEHIRGPIIFREGDRVMQRRNNYDKNVFNGDVGMITEILKDDQKLFVQYPEQTVEYDLAETDELGHALSLSIHKSQGSEYPACIIVFHNQHYMMLQRNLLYTGLTRAKKLAVFIGTSWAIKRAVSNRHVQPRYTRLAPRLQQLVDDLGSRSRPNLPGTAPTSGQNAKNANAPTMPGRLF